MEHFSPLTALVGGSMIGLASAILWIGNGRIAGISGIFGQLLPPARTVSWRFVFLAAMGRCGPFSLVFISRPRCWRTRGRTGPTNWLPSMDSHSWPIGWSWHKNWQWLHIRTRCMRISPVFHPLINFRNRFFRHRNIHRFNNRDSIMATHIRATSTSPIYIATAALSGGLFGSGLYISQMVDPLKVLRFLNFGALASGNWDPSLAFVIVAAIAIMAIAIKLTKNNSAPLFDTQFHLPKTDQLDAPLIIGAILFGIGWGMSGICPGPAITLIAFLPDNLMIFLGTMFLGSFAGTYVQRWLTTKEVTA